jgi:hypothetical protein
MYDDLVSLKDTVQQIESKVVRIAELQEIFTEKASNCLSSIMLNYSVIGRNDGY